jgi:hypothetical protein
MDCIAPGASGRFVGKPAGNVKCGASLRKATSRA